MPVTPDMLSILRMPKPPGPVPDGLKVTALTDPNSLNSAPASPVLYIGEFAYWPMSYIDNRVSFCIVSYDAKGNLLHQVELPGARYVYKITKDDNGATFWGQADQRVTLTYQQMYDMLLKP